MVSVDGLVVALLAAGRSVRFRAADKLTATLAGRPLIDWAAEAGRTVNASQHIVVTGAYMSQKSCPAGYARLVNHDAEEGLGSSLRMAARHARETGASALLVLLADMPFVRPSHLSLLIATFGADPAIPVFSHAPGNSAQPPAVLPAALFPTLEALGGDSGARSLARGATLVEAPADTLIDVDTPADLALCAQLIRS
ncbi:MAG: nucleotidyltransferase family protein [Sphingobium sp.]|nr:nucleotidyltransferase family protein [Sphingobium sp.]